MNLDGVRGETTQRRVENTDTPCKITLRTKRGKEKRVREKREKEEREKKRKERKERKRRLNGMKKTREILALFHDFLIGCT